MRRLIQLSLLAAAALSAACGDSQDLPDAIDANVVDTVSLGSLTGTPISVPSGYSLPEGRTVRTDQTSAFDFAFNLEPGGRPVLLPLAALGLTPGISADPGLQKTELGFDEISEAALNDYVTDSVIAVTVGERYYVRSRAVCTALGGVPQYGKLEVLAIDPDARSLTFRILNNNNCGYRSLLPGVPDR
jgi:hypothetical protein